MDGPVTASEVIALALSGAALLVSGLSAWYTRLQTRTHELDRKAIEGTLGSIVSLRHRSQGGGYCDDDGTIKRLGNTFLVFERKGDNLLSVIPYSEVLKIEQPRRR